MTPDEITLTMPRDRAFYSVAHLVLGGLGIRLNLTIEHLEDLQLAVDAVLERAREEEHVTIAVSVLDGGSRRRSAPCATACARSSRRPRARTSACGGSSTRSSTASSSRRGRAATGSS